MNTIKKIKNRSIIELRRFFSKCIRKNFVSEFPDLISFQTNSFCNSKCIGCPHPLVKKRIPQGKMSEVLFYKIIDECAQHNIKVVLPFFMNEPFTDRSILDKVNVIKDKIPEAIVKLNSNGALLTKEICDSLVESKINQLTLGIQGVEKVDFERFMVGLNYDITMENVKYLASLKRHFIIDVNILPFNSIRNKIDQTVQFWDDLGFIPSLTEPWDSA
jgi:MoaA/NifB/PqqE/SkfB family radical SAM enzyme